MASKTAAQRWGEDRERHWYAELVNPRPEVAANEVPTLAEFWPRFMDVHARANRQKPSGIAAKDTIGRVHLLPILGERKLNDITTERVRLAMRSAPAKAIQELAGHADLATTQRYMHLSPAAVEGAIRLLENRPVHGFRGDMLRRPESRSVRR